MDATVATVMTQLGWGQYVPVLLALFGLFSVISTVYPPTWPAASVVHMLALLKGNAAPAVPAGSTTSVVQQPVTPAPK